MLYIDTDTHIFVRAAGREACHGRAKLPKGAHLTKRKEIAAVDLRMANITPFPYLSNGFFFVADISPVTLTLSNFPGGSIPPSFSLNNGCITSMVEVGLF